MKRGRHYEKYRPSFGTFCPKEDSYIIIYSPRKKYFLLEILFFVFQSEYAKYRSRNHSQYAKVLWKLHHPSLYLYMGNSQCTDGKHDSSTDKNKAT